MNFYSFVSTATPHTHHYANAKSALLARKHVLCEKPVTSNAAELRSLISIARERNKFFMEAMWTRFQPLVNDLKRIVEEGTLGDPVVLHADLSEYFDIESEWFVLYPGCDQISKYLPDKPKMHRILNPALGGGALLDL